MAYVTGMFRNGGMQSVRIPKHLELPEGKVSITRLSDGSLVLRPALTLADYIATLEPNPEASVLDEIDDLVAEPVDL